MNKISKVKNIVDFGCADGALIREMNKVLPDINYIGYDNNSEMIKIARNKSVDTSNINYTNIFPQGQYLVSEKNGKLKPGKYEFSLITPNVVSYVYIIDKDNIQRYSKRFNSENIESKGKENFSLFSVGTLLEGDTVIIYGKGEMYFNLIQNQTSN